MPDSPRQPGESLVHWRNRLLREKGITDRQWAQSSDGRLYLRPAGPIQDTMDLGE